MVLFAVFMSLGLLLGGKELKGTCASKNVALAGTGEVCSVCGQDPNKCENKKEEGKEERKIFSEMPKIRK